MSDATAVDPTQRFGGAVPDTPVVTGTNHGAALANDNHPAVTGTAIRAGDEQRGQLGVLAHVGQL